MVSTHDPQNVDQGRGKGINFNFILFCSDKLFKTCLTVFSKGRRKARQ
jgi:hypothetical protein